MQQDQGPHGQSPNDEEAFQADGTYESMGVGRDHEGDRVSPGDTYELLGAGGDQPGDSPVRFGSAEINDTVGGPPDQPSAPGVSGDYSGD